MSDTLDATEPEVNDDPVVEPVGLADPDEFDVLASQLTAEFEQRYPDTPSDEPAEPDTLEDPEPEAEADEPAVEAEVPSIEAAAAELGLSVDDAVQVLRFAASLTPEQTEAWNAAVNGSSPIAPVAPPAGVPSAASGYGEPPTGSAPVGGTDAIPAQGRPGMPQIPDLGVLADVAPELPAYLTSLQDELAAFRAQQAELAAAEQTRQQARVRAQLDEGDLEFRSRYDHLDEATVLRVQRRATEMQILPGLIQANDGDVKAAYLAAMDTAMWSDPTIQDQLVQARLSEFTAQQEQVQDKRRKAAALSGSAGSVPRTATAAPATMTPDQRRAAMVKSIAEGIAQS